MELGGGGGMALEWRGVRARDSGATVGLPTPAAEKENHGMALGSDAMAAGRGGPSSESESSLVEKTRDCDMRKHQCILTMTIDSIRINPDLLLTVTEIIFNSAISF